MNGPFPYPPTRRCSNCGQRGHNRSTCGKQEVKVPELLTSPITPAERALATLHLRAQARGRVLPEFRPTKVSVRCVTYEEARRQVGPGPHFSAVFRVNHPDGSESLLSDWVFRLGSWL